MAHGVRCKRLVPRVEKMHGTIPFGSLLLVKDMLQEKNVWAYGLNYHAFCS